MGNSKVLVTFFTLHLLFWNQTLITLALSPVISTNCSWKKQKLKPEEKIIFLGQKLKK